MSELYETNPFIPNERREHLATMLADVCRLALVTARADLDLTRDYVRLVVAQSPLYTEGDRDTGAHASLRELAMIMHSNLNGARILPEPKGNDHDPRCERNHEAEEAFCDAVNRADFDACSNVVKAVMKDAIRKGEEGADVAVDFFADVLMLFISACTMGALGG